MIKIILLAHLAFLVQFCNKDNPVDPPGTEINTGDILNNVIINELLDKINAGDYGEIHSLLIFKDDTLIVEKYFRGYNRNDLHVCYSVTKSFASALIGIAISQGFINNTNGKLLDFFPEYSNLSNPSEWKNEITLHHLLSMSAGFDWDEFTLPYTNPDNDVRRLISSNDWIKFVLDLPVVTEPGTDFTYNSGCSTLLSGILLNKTGMNAKTFGQINLLNPLGIEHWFWEQGPNNITNTFGGLQLRPVDMIKFGKLYLQRGNWNDEQVIHESWIDYSTSTKIGINHNYEYAFQWWRYSDASTTGQVLQTNDVFYADGWGGQFIWVVPHLNMVVVSTGGNFDDGNQPLYFFRDYVIPAAYSIQSDRKTIPATVCIN
ncbi:serine hydrolase domain-containing protein [Bacteroidota bacterium]